MTASCHRLVQCARAFLGVRFAHQGRSHAGLDCLGLLMVTAESAGCRLNGLEPRTLDQCNYGTRPDTDHLQTMLERHLHRVDHALQPADILLLRIDGRPQHLALVSDYPVAGEWGMIHAYAVARRVVEHRLDDGWRQEIHARYRMPHLAG